MLLSLVVFLRRVEIENQSKMQLSRGVDMVVYS